MKKIYLLGVISFVLILMRSNCNGQDSKIGKGLEAFESIKSTYLEAYSARYIKEFTFIDSVLTKDTLIYGVLKRRSYRNKEELITATPNKYNLLKLDSLNKVGVDSLYVVFYDVSKSRKYTHVLIGARGDNVIANPESYLIKIDNLYRNRKISVEFIPGIVLEGASISAMPDLKEKEEKVAKERLAEIKKIIKSNSTYSEQGITFDAYEQYEKNKLPLTTKEKIELREKFIEFLKFKL